jgi:hypothetical protein
MASPSFAPSGPLSLLLALLLAGLAHGEGYPIPRGERAVPWQPAATVGEWRTEGTSLALAKGRGTRNFFIAQEEAAPSPSFVRARITRAPRADLALLFRTRVLAKEPLLSLTGYGLYVDAAKGEVGFVRYDGTRSDSSPVRARVRGLQKVEELEVALFLAGPAFAAHVYDARTKEQLAALAWSDSAFAQGALGVYAHRNQPPEVQVTLLVPEPQGAQAPARDSLEERWTVRLARDTPLEEGMRRLMRRIAREEDADVYVTNEVGVYLLRERGANVLSAGPGVPFRYQDSTFSERLAQARGAPVAEAFINGVKDPELVERALRALQARAPQLTRLVEIGRTHEQRPIWALLIGESLEDRSRPAVLLCAATHANEAVTPELPLDAARWLLENQADPRAARWLSTFHFVVVPLVNPDGSHAFWHLNGSMGRTNRRKDEHAAALGLLEHGVDLNRNYPFQWANVEDRHNRGDPRTPYFRGPAPGSEPEVQAMMKLGEAWRFVAMVSYHSAATRLLVPYTVEGAKNPTPSTAWAVAPLLLEKVRWGQRGKGYKAVSKLYPVGGTDQDWFHWRFGTLAYLVELPFITPSRSRPLEPMVEAARPLWQSLLERFLDGPSLTVSVPAAWREEGPVSVAIEEIAWPNGERFTAHPESGVFHTYLPQPGRYTVRATSASGTVASRTVEVGAGRALISLEESP